MNKLLLSLISICLFNIACEKTTREIVNNPAEAGRNSPWSSIPRGDLGGMDGSGGKGILCIDQNGKETVEVLDLWESRVIHNRPHLPFPAGTSMREAVNTLFDRTKYMMPDECDECLAVDLKDQAARFFPEEHSGDNTVVRLRGVDLQLTNDSYEFAKPKNCEIVQVINYQGNTGIFYIDQDLFDKMDLENQAALLAHESLYLQLRLYKADNNSLRTRRAVGYVAAGLTFDKPQLIFKPKKYVECTAGQGYYSAAHKIEMWDVKDSNDNISDLAIKVVSVDGQKLLGVNNPVITVPRQTYSWLPVDDVASGQCKNYGFNSRSFPLRKTPIEFDREVVVGFDCKQNNLTVVLEFRNPGPGVRSDRIPMTCTLK